MTASTETWDRFVDHSVRTSMFFPGSRLFVAGNPKAAGTMLRWWLLAAHGVDVEAATAGSLWRESAPSQVVWDGACDLRFTWRRLSEAERDDALSSPDVLTVHPVRHPITRAFSAWASKYLTGEPYYGEQLPATFPTLPLTVESARDVTVEFGRFVEALADHVDRQPDWDGVDVHLWPQHRLLARPVAGPLLTLRQESLDEGLGRIRAHLREHDVEPGPVARWNETVVGYRPDLVADALDLLCRLYAEDLATWGYDAASPPSSSPEPDLARLNDVRGRNRRYAVLHRATVGGRRRVAELEAELDAARQRERELLASTSWRAGAPLRWISRTARRG